MRRIWGNTKPIKGSRINFAHPLSRGLVGCWLFNEGVGDKVYDSSGNGNTGTLTSMAFPSTAASGWNPGKFGTALIFDGVNDYAIVADSNSLDIANAITIEAWVKFPAIPTGNDVLLNKEGAYRALFSSDYDDNQASMRIFTLPGTWTSVKGNTVLQANVWYHLVGTYDRINIRIYVNGVEDATPVAYATAIPINTAPLYIGTHDVAGGYYFNGTIDEVRIYNRALTATEILNLYKEPFCMFNK